MPTIDKEKLEKAHQQVLHHKYHELISPLTKDEDRKHILDETAEKIAEGVLTTDKEIRNFILEKDREFASKHDVFKKVLKIAPIALILFFIFIFIFQSLYM